MGDNSHGAIIIIWMLAHASTGEDYKLQKLTRVSMVAAAAAAAAPTNPNCYLSLINSVVTGG